MTTMQENEGFTLVESPVVPVGTTITMTNEDATQAHCFANVKFFADTNGQTPAIPGAGSVAIAVQVVNSQAFENPPSPTIDATAPATVNWAGNTSRVRATPTGITVATHYQLVVTSNKT